MQTLQEYKCPCCGGAIAFDSTLQKMKCPYCDTEFEMETLRSYDDGLQNAQDEMQWETAAGERQTDFTPISATPAAVRSWEMRTRRRPLAPSAAIPW